MCARRLSDYKLRRVFIFLSPPTGKLVTENDSINLTFTSHTLKIFEYVSEGHKPILGLAVGTCGIGFSHEEIIRGPAGRGGEDQQRSAVVMYIHSHNDSTSSMLVASYWSPESWQLATSYQFAIDF
jgi:hypothetical protein